MCGRCTVSKSKGKYLLHVNASPVQVPSGLCLLLQDLSCNSILHLTLCILKTSGGPEGRILSYTFDKSAHRCHNTGVVHMRIGHHV